MNKFKLNDRVTIDIPEKANHLYKCYNGCNAEIIELGIVGYYRVRIDQNQDTIIISEDFLKPYGYSYFDNIYEDLALMFVFLEEMSDEERKKYDARQIDKKEEVEEPLYVEADYITDLLLQLRVYIELAIIDKNKEDFEKYSRQYNNLITEVNRDIIEDVSKAYQDVVKWMLIERE